MWVGYINFFKLKQGRCFAFSLIKEKKTCWPRSKVKRAQITEGQWPKLDLPPWCLRRHRRHWWFVVEGLGVHFLRDFPTRENCNGSGSGLLRGRLRGTKSCLMLRRIGTRSIRASRLTSRPTFLEHLTFEERVRRDSGSNFVELE